MGTGPCHFRERIPWRGSSDGGLSRIWDALTRSALRATGPAMRILELFSGIGGTAAAVHGRADVVAAVDHDRKADAVYAANWPHRREVKNLAYVKRPWLASFQADLWWMSPPCAPHGIRGDQADLDDPRSAAFRNLVAAIPEVGPRYLALENVPWFHGSRAWALLETTLERAGYTSLEHIELCPTALGLPSLRRRFYAVASKGPLVRTEPVVQRRPLSDFLLPFQPELALPASLTDRFGGALHIVDADDEQAVAATFTRAYANSPVYAGSYLRQRDGEVSRLRWFSPGEIAALHGMPAGFSFAGLPNADGWKLVGNGVSVPAVRHVLGWLPDLAAG